MNAPEVDAKYAVLVEQLKSEDRDQGTRLDALEEQTEAGADAHKELERRVDDLRNEITGLKLQVTQLQSDTSRWRGYFTAVIIAAFSVTLGSVLGAAVTISLALAGFKKP